MSDPQDPPALPPDDLAAIDLETEAHIALARQAAAARATEGELRLIRTTDWRTTGRTSSPTSQAPTPIRPALTLPDGQCPDCGGAGWYKAAVPIGHPDFAKLLPCACKLVEQEARRKQEAAAQLARLQSDMGDLADKTFANFNPEWDTTPRHREILREAHRVTRRWAADPGDRWLFLTGPYGTGKSHLAAAAANHLAATGRSTYYRSALDLINALRSGYQKGDFDDRLAAICAVSLLVLDDLGSEGQTESNRGLLFSIINHRAMRAELTTIITSNAGLMQLSKPPAHIPNLDPRVASRITQRSIVVPVIANDYRERLGQRAS